MATEYLRSEIDRAR